MKFNRKIIAYVLILLPSILLFSIRINGQERKSISSSVVNTSISPYFSDLQENYDVKFYFIDITVNNNNTFITGKTQINVESERDTCDTLVFELDSRLTVDSVKVNSVNMHDFTFGDNLLFIPLTGQVRMEKQLAAEVFYRGNTGTQSFYGGVTSKQDYFYNKKVTYTLSEPFQSMMWFPCKQDLRDKVDSAWIFLTCSKGLKAGSNGLLNLVNVNDSVLRYEWKTRYPTAYYLLSFAVSDYIDYSFHVALTGSTDSLLVQSFLYNHPLILVNEKEAVDKTGEMLALFSEQLGLYPFINEKYGHCMAPMGGGMEHQTMTTLASFNFELVAHELAHQWFGNYVTCETWQDIWINEGFASYLEYFAVEKLGSSIDAETWLSIAQGNAKKQTGGSVYIPPDEAHTVSRIFSTDLSYKKGALILHMLRHEINDDTLFFSVLREFLSEFACSYATGRDFLQTLNRLTGKDYTWFFDQWYYGKGYPVFITSWKQGTDSLIINSIQETTAVETSFFRMYMDFKIVYFDSTFDVIRLLYDENNLQFSIKTEKTVIDVIADPENKVLKSSFIYEEYDNELVFKVNPNPFTSNLFIKFMRGDKNRTVRLTGLDGIRIFQTASISDYINLDLAFLGEGMYILTVIEDGREYPLKIIKLAE